MPKSQRQKRRSIEDIVTRLPSRKAKCAKDILRNYLRQSIYVGGDEECEDKIDQALQLDEVQREAHAMRQAEMALL